MAALMLRRIIDILDYILVSLPVVFSPASEISLIVEEFAP